MDIIEVLRIEKAATKEGFLQRVFTEQEREYCLSLKVNAAPSLAARFSAKEALLKALGTGLREGRLTDIEVVRDELGKPEIVLYNNFKVLAEELGVKKIHLSMSHTRQNAVAQVILEG